MNPDDIVEAFVSTIVIGVLLVVLAQILAPDLGQLLIGVLPEFVEAVVYVLIIAIFARMLWALVE